MENGAKNKAILLSPWGTTGQCLCQAAANFLPDYFRTARSLSGHIGKQNVSKASILPQPGWAADILYTHIHSSLTCYLIDLSVSGTNYGSGGKERDEERWRRQSCPHP